MAPLLLLASNGAIIFLMSKTLPNHKEYSFKHHFVPHPHHKTRATLLSHSAIFTYLLGIVLIFGSFRLISKTFPGVLGYASDITTQDLLNLTNQKRLESGLTELRINSALSSAAKRKAEDMFKEGYWSHISPSGTEPWDFILRENYDYVYAGENLAKNFNTSKDVVQAWVNSSSHKENIMNKNYEEIGFAVVNGVLDGYETTLVVQMFGKSRTGSYVASAKDENKILESVATVSEDTGLVPDPKNEPIQKQIVIENPVVQPTVDIATASKAIGLVFVIYIVVLLLLDIWYSKRHSIFKLTGHSLAHLSFLMITLVGMLLMMMPGKIL
ncbi:MAG: hypothetical protein UU77_C0002G0020 [candidate division WWE3 bacterium GW2011_GWC1_41_7]|uniref:SCP domain-containing protein n=1 Tax=candidate division WWE3 bacterium GW2011_GWC1_41_7 TaxID=1619119 RepID=A0A0G0X8U4_UNCKA|nr:MAG: hypothetical protein UU77_C0002G0020 [candidate division WWE3 bacterium GW2011_GWC1_41_7]